MRKNYPRPERPVGESDNGCTDIPTTSPKAELYKESELSICRNCKFLDRDCSAIPLSLFKSREFEIYTTSCRDFKDNNPRPIFTLDIPLYEKTMIELEREGKGYDHKKGYL